MSWSVSVIGLPENVARYLEGYDREWCDCPSKLEYQAVKPHLLALVRQNFATETKDCIISPIKLVAKGSGSGDDGVPTSRRFGVTIEPIYDAELV